MGVTKLPSHMSTNARVGGQPSLLVEEWEQVSMNEEDFEPEALVMSILPKRGWFLKIIGAEVKDVFGMWKKHMPTTTS